MCVSRCSSTPSALTGSLLHSSGVHRCGLPVQIMLQSTCVLAALCLPAVHAAAQDSPFTGAAEDSRPVPTMDPCEDVGGGEVVMAVDRSRHLIHASDEGKSDTLYVAGDAHMQEPELDDVDALYLYEDAGLGYDAIVFGANGVREDVKDEYMVWEGGRPRSLQHRRGPHGSRSDPPPQISCTNIISLAA